jgi:L-ascorbate metabolism protein UlaG (beta-lactamase superfamily)
MNIKEGRMKITKLVHACLLVETPDRAALFDPGVYSREAVQATELTRLDDIFITHNHSDHLDAELIKNLRDRFPEVRITAPGEALDNLESAGVTDVLTSPSDGVELFDAPHEAIRPYIDSEPAEEYGYHYLDLLSHPGDSHSFHETKAVLALPVLAPWGSTVNAVKLALDLKPQYVIPIHDWFYHEQARASLYHNLGQIFSGQGITFLHPDATVSVEI